MTTAGRTLNLQAAIVLTGGALALLALLAALVPKSGGGDGVWSSSGQNAGAGWDRARLQPPPARLRTEHRDHGPTGRLPHPRPGRLALPLPHRGDPGTAPRRRRGHSVANGASGAPPRPRGRRARIASRERSTTCAAPTPADGAPRSRRSARSPTWGRLHPGIGVRYYGAEGRFGYDFELAPQADPRRIELRFDGARGVLVAANGDLLLRLPGGTVRERAPVAYQRIDGERNRVAARYVLDGERVRFALGNYRRSQPLTIDPLVLPIHLRRRGPRRRQRQRPVDGLAVDPAGSAYITGDTRRSISHDPGGLRPEQGLNRPTTGSRTHS